MNDFYQTTLYLNVVRSPTKSVKHCCTGQTQIERASKNLSYADLQYSLNHSKMLKRFLQRNPLSQPFDENTLQELCHIKNITHDQSKFYVRKALKQYQAYKFSLRKIEELRKQKYDKKNEEHQELLLEIWKNLKPKQQLKDRISNQWIDIGFQANDPATDFRGAGYLGLLNLVKFSRQKKCKNVFHWAINKDTEYFFCSAGLFFTMTAVQLINSMVVPVDIWVFQLEEQIINKFQAIYDMLFMEFDNFWKSCQNKSIMEFNNNLLRFKSQINTLSPQQVKQKVIYWKNI